MDCCGGIIGCFACGVVVACPVSVDLAFCLVAFLVVSPSVACSNDSFQQAQGSHCLVPCAGGSLWVLEISCTMLTEVELIVVFFVALFTNSWECCFQAVLLCLEFGASLRI